MPYRRNRFIYVLLLGLVICLGLLSRQPFIPAWIYPYLGDAFYAMMIYVLVAIIFNKARSSQIFLIAVAVCFAIEVSQFYQADWINAVRKTKLGGLVLGFGFLWSDLLSYLTGAFVAFVLEKRLLRTN